MTTWWPRSALIQPRTSLGKSDVSTVAAATVAQLQRGPFRPRHRPARTRARCGVVGGRGARAPPTRHGGTALPRYQARAKWMMDYIEQCAQTLTALPTTNGRYLPNRTLQCLCVFSGGDICLLCAVWRGVDAGEPRWHSVHGFCVVDGLNFAVMGHRLPLGLLHRAVPLLISEQLLARQVRFLRALACRLANDWLGLGQLGLDR